MRTHNVLMVVGGLAVFGAAYFYLPSHQDGPTPKEHGPTEAAVLPSVGTESGASDAPAMPSIVAGFRFGMTLAETRAHCPGSLTQRAQPDDFEMVGNVPQPFRSFWHCETTPVPLDFAEPGATLDFCGGPTTPATHYLLCAVIVHAQNIEEVATAIRAKYGQEDRQTSPRQWVLKGGVLTLHEGKRRGAIIRFQSYITDPKQNF